jgi:hypothetical protein
MTERTHPVFDHYGSGEYEPIKIINHYNLNFNLGNVIKYTLRAGKKEDNTMLSDLKKAVDYLQYEIERITEPEEVLNPPEHDGCDGCKYINCGEYEYPCCECHGADISYSDRWEAK